MMKSCLPIIFALSLSFSPALAANKPSALSVLPRSGHDVPVKTPIEVKPASAKTEQPSSDLQPNTETKPGALTDSESSLPSERIPVTPALYSAAIEQAVRQYRSNPDDLSFSQILEALKTVLNQPASMRISSAMLTKDNPSLQEFRPRVIEAGSARVWTFPKSREKNQILLQYLESKPVPAAPTPTRKKWAKPAISTTLKLQLMSLPQSINVREAGFITSKDGPRHLILAGEGEDGSLWVNSYHLQDGIWQERSEFLNALPSILIKNVSGHVAFRGQDMIFNVARMVQTIDSSGIKRSLPEAESATYSFWVKLSDAGYVIVPNVPDEDAFKTVGQFMQAVQQGRTDIAKALLVDPRILSIPKYLGLNGKPLDPGVHVVQMSLPSSKGHRFRLTNTGKDELIFDVAKVKGVPQIKAIFIAPPEPFLQETSKYFPLYSKLIAQPAPEQKPDAVANPELGSKKKL